MTEPGLQHRPATSGATTEKVVAPHRAFTLFICLFLAALAYASYRVLYRPNVASPVYLYIPTGAGFAAVQDSLVKNELLDSPGTFLWLARRRDYPQHIRPGRYALLPDMGNLALLRRLENGEQALVDFHLKPFQYLENLPRQVSRQLEADSFKLELLLNDNAGLLARYGLDTCTIRTLFIPGGRALRWNSSAAEYLDSMAAGYRRFWTARRRAQADSLGLSQTQVSILASIVQRETAQPLDRPRIAAVYLNRLRLGQPLQADPTLLWPLHGLGTRKRVLNVDKRVASPYNTYRHKGLPPGPITTPYASTLDAVLRPARSRDLFFCARPDGSGFSDFAETYKQHKQNARRYWHRLDSLGIRR